jgi:hypothetical protein
MRRTPKLTRRFHQRQHALQVTGPAARAVARTVAALAHGPLPGPDDAETMVPPVHRLWFRRVPGHNLWLFYRFDEATITIATMSASPPVPIREG